MSGLVRPVDVRDAHARGIQAGRELGEAPDRAGAVALQHQDLGAVDVDADEVLEPVVVQVGDRDDRNSTGARADGRFGAEGAVARLRTRVRFEPPGE